MDDQNTTDQSEVKYRGEHIEVNSATLKKDLGLADVTLMQILILLSPTWIGTAAKLGPSHIFFWLPAMVLFFIPSAVVVTYLNRFMPFEGGLYQWAKFGFNDFVGFLVAWNYYVSNIVFMSTIGLDVATHLSYAIGPSAAWLSGSEWFITLANCVVICSLMIISTLGLGAAKRLHNAGGGIRLALFATLAALLFINPGRCKPIEYHPLASWMPPLSLFSLNILAKMGLGALGGFDEATVFAGECRDPVRTIGRSVAIAAPIVASLYILATSSVVAFVPPNDIDLIGTIQQALASGLRPFGLAGYVVPAASLALLTLIIATGSVVFSQTVRFPMVAGWDRLLPRWFTKLHGKRKTPVNSIRFLGAVTLSIALAGLVGVGYQEAFQLLLNASFVLWALTYLVMFAIPLVRPKCASPQSPGWVKVASGAGLLMTLLYVVFSILPIIEVQSRLVFAAKISGTAIAANAIGSSLFVVAEIKRRRSDSRAA